MSHALVIRVHFHDGRYHGAGDWPPSPARLFQALVAAAGLNGQLAAARESLQWFESKRLPSAPIIGAPNARRGQRVMFYMPNNDLDSVQGDPRRVAEIRTAKKFFSPWLFDVATPFLYVWQDVADADERHAQAIVSLANHLYQLGRGIDMAWASGELLGPSAVDGVLASYAGPVYRPSAGDCGIALPCQQPGSLASIEKRYQACRRRFEVKLKGRTVRLTLRQAPRPMFRSVTYDSPPSRRVYDLRETGPEARFFVHRVSRAFDLVEWIRDEAARRLRAALPASHDAIERAVIGRKADGADDGPTSQRIRIIPLPSIGHPHADRGIRRVVVEVPSSCPFRADDVHWAISGIERGGELVVSPSADERMLSHFTDAARTWRSVTPVALPQSAARRRIEPARIADEAKGGSERAAEEAKAAAAVVQALRHANARTTPEAIRVQREPFDLSGERAEAFADGARFTKHRLWHVEITFATAVEGPLVIGDGRFLGLGVMAPVLSSDGIHVFDVESGLAASPDPEALARALRRAVMARVQEVLGGAAMPAYFSGHVADGGPVRAAVSSHLAFAFDPAAARLLVVAPHALDRRPPSPEERNYLRVLQESLRDLRELRAGSAGLLVLRPAWIAPVGDPLTSTSRVWETLTWYCVNRHAKEVHPSQALRIDLQEECQRRGLSKPEVEVLEFRGVPSAGLMGRVKLLFAAAVKGPLLLGKTRYRGGGLFRAEESVPSLASAMAVRGGAGRARTGGTL